MSMSIVLSSDDIAETVNYRSVSSTPFTHWKYVSWRNMSNNDHIITFFFSKQQSVFQKPQLTQGVCVVGHQEPVHVVEGKTPGANDAKVGAGMYHMVVSEST